MYVADRSFFAQWYVFGTMDDEGLEQSKALAQPPRTRRTLG